MRRVRIATGAAVVASALVIGGVVVTNSIDDKNAVAPATGGAEDTALPGAMYLPPEGATPSNPASGELVASMEARFGVGVYVYADGRVIWKRPLAAPPTGWAEGRLTPEGVELVQAEILSTGLFDPGRVSDDDVRSDGYIQVRNGDRLVLALGGTRSSVATRVRSAPRGVEGSAVVAAGERMGGP